jgi:hypothetical protein
LTQRSANNPRPAPPGHPDAEDPHRAYACRVAAEGFALLAHAVNACDNPATRYRFAEEERERFMSLCAKLYALIETGRIEPRAAAMAQDDIAFQRFVSRSLGSAPEPKDGA